MLFNHTQQNARRSIRPAPSLFPILDRTSIQPKAICELHVKLYTCENKCTDQYG